MAKKPERRQTSLEEILNTSKPEGLRFVPPAYQDDESFDAAKSLSVPQTAETPEPEKAAEEKSDEAAKPAEKKEAPKQKKTAKSSSHSSKIEIKNASMGDLTEQILSQSVPKKSMLKHLTLDVDIAEQLDNYVKLLKKQGARTSERAVVNMILRNFFMATDSDSSEEED